MVIKKGVLVSISLVIIIFLIGVINFSSKIGISRANTTSSLQTKSSLESSALTQSVAKQEKLIDPVTSSMPNSQPVLTNSTITQTTPQPIIIQPVTPPPVVQPEEINNPLQYGLSNDVSWDSANFGSNRKNSIISGPWILSSWEEYHSKWLKKFSEPGQENSTPYVYSYIIAGLARENGLEDCNVGAPKNKTLCYGGSQYIRDNKQKIINAYIQSANGIKSVYGTSKKFYFHLEPDYYQYAELNPGFGNATTPLNNTEAWSLMNSITDQVKSILPNAELVMDVSSWNVNLSNWHSGFKQISYGGMVGRAFSPNGTGEDNYAALSGAIGKKLFVNVSHGIGGDLFTVEKKWYDPAIAQLRYNDGVVGVLLPP